MGSILIATTKAKEVARQPPLSEQEMQPPNTFVYKELHSSKKAEEVSDICQSSVAQARLTLKAGTRRILWSDLMPLAQRYRVNRIYMTPRLRCKMATDTMHARKNPFMGSNTFRYSKKLLLCGRVCHQK